MSTTAGTAKVTLSHRFADALPELALPWKASAPAQPRILALNTSVAQRLGWDVDWLRGDGIRLLCGTDLPDGATSVAQGYAGHQFGGYSPRLGDGRALLLGEVTAPTGELLDVHLKGSGRTPFARGGDGLAALAPMLREYVIAHAMGALGIPSTQSLAVLATGAAVRRETPEPGGLLVRVAASHLRVGSFQYARALAAGDNAGPEVVDLPRRLADYAIARHYPELAATEEPYLGLLEAVAARQARLITQWMMVGFVHGVLNTDNVTISGESIDFGPCAFLDAYDPATVFSSIDQAGRYAYAQQPGITEWNLARFAESILDLLHPDQDRAVAIATGALERYRAELARAWADGMRGKLGLSQSVPDTEVASLAAELLDLMATQRVDFTSFWRALSFGPERARDLVIDRERFDSIAKRWLRHEPDLAAMAACNPVYIPRNHLVEEALQAASAGDLAPFEQLVEVLADPFTERPGLQRYAEPAEAGTPAYVTYCGT